MKITKILCPLILILSLNAFANQKNSISFLAIGDTPYTKEELHDLKNKIIPAMQKSNYPFVVVYGDILSGRESCTNELLITRLNTFYNIKKSRVFYTPGDNDWTDCDRSNKNKPFSEIERLNYIRAFIASHKPYLPKKWKYKRQKELIENASWFYKGIQFATLHMVSTNNARTQILKDDKNKALDEVDYRDKKNLQWLNSTFKDAKENNAQAVIFISQADITKSKAKNSCTKQNRTNCNPFKNFNNHLRQKAKQFQKPILFLHGDSNPYCFDKKFGKDMASNLWRLNSWGDYKEYADATAVKFNPHNKNNPFEAHTLSSNELPKNSCK